MSVLTMDMSSYEVRNSALPEDVEYSEEVLCSGWVPTLATQLSQDFENRGSIPEDLATVDAALFLRKMYLLQR